MFLLLCCVIVLEQIKVLQLGIMIHSLVIGLTLAVTSGADFSKPRSSLNVPLLISLVQRRS